MQLGILFALENVQYFPSRNSLGKWSPFLYYTSWNSTSFYVTYRHWTTCHTVTFIMPFQLPKLIHAKLSAAYKAVGFEDATNCLNDGHYCVLKELRNQTETKERIIGTKKIAMYPVYIFYIVPATPKYLQELVKKLDFSRVCISPFLQYHFRISYPIIQNEARKELTSITIQEEVCTEFTFMCKFCKRIRNGKPQNGDYSFVHISQPCRFYPQTNRGFRSTMDRIIMTETGDGKFVPHFRLNAELPREELLYKSQSKLKPTKIQDILLSSPKIDDIIYNILVEQLPGITKWSLYSKNSDYLPVLGAMLNETIISIIQMEFRSYNFLTCDSSANNLSLNLAVYFNQFHYLVWLTLLLTLAISLIFIRATIQILKTLDDGLTNNQGKIDYFSVLLTITALLLNTVVASKELYKNVKLRVFFSAWLLTSIVISNAYTSHTLAKTTAPTKEKRLEKFHQLEEFKLFINGSIHSRNPFSRHSYNSKSGEGSDEFRQEFIFDVLTWLSQIVNASVYSKITLRAQMDIHMSSSLQPPIFALKDYKVWGKKTEAMTELLTQLQPRSTPTMAGVEKYLGNCKKTAYIGPVNEIKEIEKYFRNNCKPFIYAGNDKLFEKSGAWLVHESGGGYMRRRMSYLSESGIYHFWKKWVKSSSGLYTKRNASCSSNEFMPRKVSLRSNSVVIFLMLALAYGVLVIILVFEISICRIHQSN
ncbi:unnamed protein product [Orchesella dallaii]|uniref:Ionotropic glutamate receptor C-terminal domain-containing protein n=1 Tax=Orchesella dallaii TaxID=48710 RepID=A0ABP1RFU0_9HEXA